MKISSYLDFNLQAYQERLGLVNFLDEQGILAQCPSVELDKVANYLLYAEDVDAEVELKEGSKKKVSYESLIESTLGENTVQKSQEISVYRVPRPTIDKEKDADIPGMRDLWEAIAIIEERYKYCKDVLEGKRDMDPERKLIPTYQNKYFMREWMIDLRREQFLLKDIFKPVICNLPSFGSFTHKADHIGMKIGRHMLCETGMEVDYGDWKHIYAMLKYYNGMKSVTDENPYHDWWYMYEFLDELIARVRWSPEHEIILWRKVNHVPNENIVAELESLGYKAYSVNYVSTIWKQHISKRIAKQAELWWKEHAYKPDGTMETMTKWKVCAKCGRQLFADELNFGKYQDGTWRDVCKDCTYKDKIEKEQRRKERESNKSSSKKR